MDTIKFKTPSGMFFVEVEAETPKEAFERASAYAEVFSDTCCGVCSSPNIFPRIRLAGDKDEYTYYEMVCLNQDTGNGQACRAKLSYGERNDKGSGNPIYPKRKNEDGTWSLTRGWNVYKKQDGDEPQHRAAASAPRSLPPPQAPPSAARPDETRALDTELVAFIKRAEQSPRERAQVIGEMFDKLRVAGGGGKIGDDLATQVYNQVDKMQPTEMLDAVWKAIKSARGPQ